MTTPTGILLRDTVFAEADSNAITVTIPANTQPGDQILARLSHATNSGINAPQATTCSDTDFTLLNQASEAAALILTETWTKIAALGDAGKTITFTVPAAATARTTIYLGVYYNGSTHLPITVGPNTLDNGTLSNNPAFSYTFNPNLALGKPATASSVGTVGYEASKAFDGTTSTGWASEYSDPQWVKVDLGSVKQISQVVMRWETASAKAFEIQVSDDATTWTAIYKTTTGPGGVHTIPVSGSGRHVRLYGTQRNTGYGYYLYEFEIYGQETTLGGLAVLLGSTQLAAGTQWSTTTWPAGFSYRGQVSIPGNSHALGVVDGPAPTVAGAKTYNWPTTASANYLTNVAVVAPPQGAGSLPVTVTLRASGSRPRIVGDGDSATFAESTTRKENSWWASTLTSGLSVPFDVFVDPVTGDAYVTEYSGHKITKITPGGVKTTFAGSGVAGFNNGSATTAQFNSPRGICRDAAGNFYIGDSGNQRIRKIDPSGNVTTVAGTGTAGYLDGPAATAQFAGPAGVAVDSAGNLYVTERDGHRVRKIDTSGNVTLVAGSTAGATGTVNAIGSAARFYYPHNCRLTPDGTTLYIADQYSNAIRKVDLATTMVTSWGSMTGPVGVEIHPVTGLVYGACYDAVRVFEVSATGTATAIAGTGAVGFVDNVLAGNAQFNRPVGLAITPDGSILVADYGDGRIRRLNPARSISGNDTGTFTDAQTDPGVTWLDKGTFTESAAVFRGVLGTDTGTFTEAVRFDDPDQSPPRPKFTGQEEHGYITPTGSGVNFGTVTVNPGELLLVSFWGYVNANVPAPTTLVGLGMTFKRFAVTGGSGYILSSFWGHYNGDVALTGTLTVSGGGAPGPWSVVHVTGHNSANPIAQVGYGLTLPAAANVSSRAFAAFGAPNTGAPGVRANWQQASLGVCPDPTLALGVHWRSDIFENTASATNYNFGYAFEIQPAAIPVTDTDTGTFTDAQTEPGITMGDAGTFTDSATQVGLTGADSGKVTETAVVAVGRFSADTGVLDEGAIVSDVAFADTDHATLAEAASIAATIGRSDTATFKDAATVRADMSDADTGLFVEDVVYLGVPTTPIAGADTGALVGEDAVLDEIVHAAATTDTGLFVESASIAGSGDVSLSAADTATVSDAHTLRVNLTDTDSGAFTDAQTDPADVSYQDRTGTDTATITDKAVRVGVWTDTDTATITDAESVIRLDRLVDGDTAAMTDEAVLVQIKTSDHGSIIDQTFDLVETARIVNEIDNGRFRDRLDTLIKDNALGNSDLAADDHGLLAEVEQSLFVDVGAADSGTFGEAASAYLANLSLSDDDQATVTETQTLAEVLTSADTGLVDEAVIIRLTSQATNDQAIFVEGDAALFVMAAAGDTATIADEAIVSRVDTSDADTGVFVEDVVYVGIVITPIEGADAGSVTEQAVLEKFSNVVASADTGHITESADLAAADAFLTIADDATVVDSQTLHVSVSDADGAAFSETQIVTDGSSAYLAGADTATVTDKAIRVGLWAETDSASIVDAEVVDTVERVSPAVGVWDRANFTDAAVAVHLWADDAGSITDEVSNLSETRRTLDTTDGGSFRDRLSVLFSSNPDGGLLGMLSDEPGIFTEAAEELFVDIADAETGTVTDSGGLFGQTAVSEAATVAFTATQDLIAAPRDTDPVRLVIEDAQVNEIVPPIVGQYSDDSGTFTETPVPVIALSDDDTNLLTDGPDPIVGPQSDDSATMTDDLVAVGLASDDTGALADTDTPVIALSDGDAGTIDEPSSQIGIAGDDSGAVTEADALFVTLSIYDFGPFDDEVAESRAQVPADDTGALTDGELLFAEDTDDDAGAFVDAASLLAAALDTDTATLTDAGELSAAAEDADTARFTETAVVRVELGGGQTGLMTSDSGLITEDQDVSAQVPAADTGALTDGENLFVDITDAEIGLFAEGQALAADEFGDETGRFTEAALLFSDTGTGAFTGEDGRFTEAATVVTWEAFVYPQDDDAITVAETQSVHRRNPNQLWIESRPGSLLKVNVVTRRVYLTDYFTADEYPISHPLPDAARFKLDAFGAVLTPNARLGDELEDADFRYRYEARWVTPNRREIGWYIVAWRRSPDGPFEWLA